MKIKQLSMFLENTKGHLKAPCQALAHEGLNILTLSLADTAQFGILRLLVNDPDRAQAVLEKAGHVVRVTEVVAIEVENRPGGLAELLEVIEQAELNIEYMYAFTFGREGKAVMVFRFSDADAAIEGLKARNVPVLQSIGLGTPANQ